jgi:hypothetical protein
VAAAQIARSPRELLEPRFVGFGHRERQQRPGRFGTHGGDIREIYREGTVADGRRRRAGREMHTFHQRIGDRHQLARSRRHQHRAVVAHADAHVGARCAEAREVPADEFEFGLGQEPLR